jgi:hypothetical protein
MSKKLTPWFPGDVKPVRKGWYETGTNGVLHHRSRGFLTGRPFRYWTGFEWVTASPDLIWCDRSIFGTHPTHQWRGLAEKP